MNPIDPLHWFFAADPNRTCLLDGRGQQWTYGQVLEAAARWSATLEDLGVEPGDRVAVQVEKSLDAVLLYLGCLHRGAALVPLNTAYTASELAYFLADAAPTLFVGSSRAAPGLESVVASAGVGRFETLDGNGRGTLAASVASQTRLASRPSHAPQALAALLYTSGTTGRSKGAMLTRANLVANADALRTTWQIVADDVLVHVLPLFHVHGLFLSLNPVFAAGASVHLLERFEAAETLEALADATLFMGVPTHYTRLLSAPALNRTTVGHVRLFVSGSAPLLAETHREFEQRTGQVILERYGMTETLVNTSNPYTGTRKPGSVGLPLPGVEVRISAAQRSDDGHDVGMIEVRGANVCAGYWRAPEKTAADRTDDGFFRTGDLGYLDQDGYVHISGRAKDLVITGGYNVYPKEIEMELDSLPGILESAVFGAPHPDFGEGVTAAVTLRAGAAADEAGWIAELRTRLAAYKVPKRILAVTELPRNTMGKVQKNRLRETHAELYAPQSQP